MLRRIDQDESGFGRFWRCYPRREAKKDAMKAWQQVNGDEHLPEILAALDWQCRSEQWLKNGGQFVPLPGSYLRGERWTDEQPQMPQMMERTVRTLTAVDQWIKRGA